jgi:hypothetical protein
MFSKPESEMEWPPKAITSFEALHLRLPDRSFPPIRLPEPSRWVSQPVSLAPGGTDPDAVRISATLPEFCQLNPHLLGDRLIAFLSVTLSKA